MFINLFILFSYFFFLFFDVKLHYKENDKYLLIYNRYHILLVINIILLKLNIISHFLTKKKKYLNLLI